MGQDYVKSEFDTNNIRLKFENFLAIEMSWLLWKFWIIKLLAEWVCNI